MFPNWNDSKFLNKTLEGKMYAKRVWNIGFSKIPEKVNLDVLKLYHFYSWKTNAYEIAHDSAPIRKVHTYVLKNCFANELKSCHLKDILF